MTETTGNKTNAPTEQPLDRVRYRDEPSPDILNREITLAFGTGRKDLDFQNKRGTVGQLLETLGRFEEGGKDGLCLLQGEVRPRTDAEMASKSSNRKSKNMLHNDVVMFDIDTGMTVEEIAERLTDKNVFGLIWTTYSNGKSETEIGEALLERFARKVGAAIPQDSTSPETLTLLVRYLKEDRRYRDRVLPDGGVINLGRRMGDNGMAYFVKHAPMTKARVLLLLDKPFDFTEGTSQTARIDAWKHSYKDASEWLDIPADQACTDPARLQYGPRLKSRSVLAETTPVVFHDIVVVDGEPLDFEGMELEQPQKGQGSPVSGILSHMGASGASTRGGAGAGTWQPQTVGLFKLAATCPDFDAIQFCCDHIGDPTRETDANRADFDCPNADSHSNGQPSGFFASFDPDAPSWGMHCNHEGCKTASNNDRLWYLDTLCQEHGLTVDDLRQYSETARKGDADKEAAHQKAAQKHADTWGAAVTLGQDKAALDRAVEDFNATPNEAGRDALLCALATLDPMAMVIGKTVEAIKGASGTSLPQLRKRVRELHAV